MKLTMRQNSLLSALYNAFKGEKYVKREELMTIVKELKHRESNGERRLRELAQRKLIRPDYERDGIALYIVGYYNLKIKL
jgi:RIO-like serine/threonine protein kinase